MSKSNDPQDTPITDAAADFTEPEKLFYVSRQLERELAQKTAEVEALKREKSNLGWVLDEHAEPRIEKLLEENAQLKQEVGQLQKALQGMLDAFAARNPAIGEPPVIIAARACLAKPPTPKSGVTR